MKNLVSASAFIAVATFSPAVFAGSAVPIPLAGAGIPAALAIGVAYVGYLAYKKLRG